MAKVASAVFDCIPLSDRSYSKLVVCWSLAYLQGQHARRFEHAPSRAENVILVKLQKRAARIILNKVYNTHRGQLFAELRWMPLLDKIVFLRTARIFRYLNDPDEQNSKNFFRYNSNMYNYNTTGVKNSNLYIAQKHPESFIHLGSTAWNDVPPTIRSANNIANYKRLYKKHHFENLNN